MISFDAHLDLRFKFLGSTLSHMTFMHLISEEVKHAKIIELAPLNLKRRSSLRQKGRHGIFLLPTNHQRRLRKIARQLKEMLASYDNLYLTVDIDLLDPGFAPAVQNPEPEG